MGRDGRKRNERGTKEGRRNIAGLIMTQVGRLDSKLGEKRNQKRRASGQSPLTFKMRRVMVSYTKNLDSARGGAVGGRRRA